MFTGDNVSPAQYAAGVAVEWCMFAWATRNDEQERTYRFNLGSEWLSRAKRKLENGN